MVWGLSVKQDGNCISDKTVSYNWDWHILLPEVDQWVMLPYSSLCSLISMFTCGCSSFKIVGWPVATWTTLAAHFQGGHVHSHVHLQLNVEIEVQMQVQLVRCQEDRGQPLGRSNGTLYARPRVACNPHGPQRLRNWTQQRWQVLWVRSPPCEAITAVQ